MSGEARAAYVHVPFCAHRCGYCNFTLVAGRDDLIEAYLIALERELAQLGEPRPVDTLFLGGGTPTHLAPPQLDRLLRLVRHWFTWSAPGEFSIEANPRDLDAERVNVLAQHGLNRVSIGAQSFRAEKLHHLERDHHAAEIVAGVERLRGHVESISLDLIFGCPGESLEQWQSDLQQAIELRPQHLSTYGLTIEQGTMFWNRQYHGQLASIDEEIERAMYSAAMDQLADAGYEHYEVSNFAQRGYRCRHNETYWAAESYYAAGPGAARYLGGRREVNHRSTTTWIKRMMAGESPVAECEELSAEDRAREALVLALRRRDGVERASFAQRFGYTVDELLGAELPRLGELGLLADDGARVTLLREGLFVSDAIWPRLLRR